MISVCIPVGPHAWYKEYLAEALESVMQQTMLPHDIVLIDDMAGLTVDDLKPLIREPSDGAVSSVVECAEARFPIPHQAQASKRARSTGSLSTSIPPSPIGSPLVAWNEKQPALLTPTWTPNSS